VALAATDRHYDVLGLDVRVVCDDVEAQHALDDLLEPFAVGSASDGGPWRRFDLTVDPSGGRSLLRDGDVIAHASSWISMIGALLIALNRDAIDAFAGFATHAGCVASGQDVIAFPGYSGAGKTTLTAACLLHDLDYVSDEALCIHRAGGGEVVPYPRPLALARDAWQLLARSDLSDAGLAVGEDESVVRADQLGARRATGELHVAHIVELRRRAGRTRLVPQPRQRGLALLLSMSFNHFKEPRESFEVASILAAGSSSWRLEYADPLDAAALLRAELAG
jgi:hypothetical protein